MKHITGLTKQFPIVADETQDLICSVNGTMQDLLALKGDVSTVKDFVDTKCPGSQGDPV